MFRSDNRGELAAARWQDLNVPSRLATLACAGVPLIQGDNADAVVASQSLARELDIGIAFSSADDLATQLRDADRMAALRRNVWRQRELFSFDEHADELLAFFRRVLVAKGRCRRSKLQACAGGASRKRSPAKRPFAGEGALVPLVFERGSRRHRATRGGLSCLRGAASPGPGLPPGQRSEES